VSQRKFLYLFIGVQGGCRPKIKWKDKSVRLDFEDGV